MKKKKLLVGLLVAGSMLGLAACNNENAGENGGNGTTDTLTYTITYNLNGHGEAIASVSNATALPAQLPTPTADGYTFLGWYSDEALTTQVTAGATISANTTLYAKWEAVETYSITYVMNGHGTAIDNTVGVSTIPAELPTPTDSEYNFLGWYLDEKLSIPATAGAALTEDTTLYADWIKNDHERVSYVLDTSTLEPVSSDEPVNVNRFTIGAKTTVRGRNRSYTDPDTGESFSFTKSVKLGNSSDALLVNVPGDGVLTIYIQNGSTGAVTQKVILVHPNGTEETIEYPATNIEKISIPVTAGTYTIKRTNGTSDIYHATLNCEVLKSEETGFEIVSGGVVEYIEGQDLDLSKLKLNKVFGDNVMTEELSLDDSNVVIDASNYDKTKAGTYTISVKYKEYEAQTYQVTVYALDDIELAFTATEKLSTNTSAGNGVYFNHSVQRVYGLNQAFDSSHLTVTAITSLGTATESFILGNALYTIDTSNFDNTKAGTYEITVSVALNGKTKTSSYNVYVVDTAPSIVDEVIQVQVNPSYEGVIGAIDNGYNTFTTIQQALDYLENLDSATYASTKKLLSLAAGTYTEKLEIVVPNLEIRGAGKDTTKIEWDSLYGIKDASGYEQVTDSTASVNVREQAINCVITNVTISNFWNSLSVFDQYLGTGYQEHRALALLVQADKFTLKDSSLLGYQDTVEFFTGRQLIENCYISGTTDFIFGTNNTTYFKNCTIHSIQGTQDGGYITAFKGCNKGSGDYVEYGAIFDGCNFTADTTVAAGKTAIGRTWGAYAAVMVMNSTLDAHISKAGYSGGSKEQRYVSMSGNQPTDATVKFTEYNNTGAGAITEPVAGCTLITDSTIAAKYADYGVIFGTENGLVRYTTAWNPESTVPEVDNNTYYIFNASTSITGTSYTYNTSLGANATEDKTATLGDMTLDATAGKISFRASDTQVNPGAKITINVKAGTKVTVETYPGYHGYTLNGVETTLDTFSQYYAEDTAVVLTAVETVYLYRIIVQPDQEAPAEKTVSKLQFTGETTKFTLNSAFEADGLVVRALYSDGSVRTLTNTEYTVDSSAVVASEVGTYPVKLSFGGIEATYNVEYLAEISTVISTSTTYSFKDDTNAEAANYIVYKDQAINPTLVLDKITITAVNGSAADNNVWLKFNTGSTITFEVAGPCTITVTTYQDAAITTIKLGDTVVTGGGITDAGIVTIEAIADGYIGSISIEFPA